MIRSLGIHIGLLVLGSAVAARAWLDEDNPKHETSVEVWGGSADSVQSIEFTAKQRHVVLNATKDDVGRYFVADVTYPGPSEDEENPDSPHGAHGKGPHGDRPHDAPPDIEAPQAPDAPDEGNGGAAGTAKDPAKPEEPPPMKTDRFVAVTDVGKLAGRLAPLKAIRSLGKLDPARYAEFGFDAAEPARVKVLVGGATRELIFGGKTPGGQDLYVRTAEGDQTFVVDGQIARDLEAAESRLLERSLHAWEDDDALSAKVTVGQQSRQLGRSPEKKSSWGDPANLAEKDETATNWMTKLERLRIVQYVEKAEPPPEPVFSVEYFSDKGKLLGRVEVAKRPADPSKPDAKPEYLARSEHTRWWGQVIQSTGEQLAQDATGVVQH